MYGLIHLADGSTEYIPNAERFERLVYDKLGRDAAEIVAEMIRQGDVAKIAVDTDLHAYETENEALVSAVMQASEMAGKLRDKISTLPPTYRAKLAREVTAIERTLDAVV